MAKTSAGILLYRINSDELEIFLIHPGGPFWMKKDDGVWSIPKGEYMDGEGALDAARREFEEETGFACIEGNTQALGSIKLNSGKVVSAWAIEGDCDASVIRSNLFSMEWPPRSGKMQEFPEVDRAAWLPLVIAKKKIHPAQCAFLDRLVEMVQAKQRA